MVKHALTILTVAVCMAAFCGAALAADAEYVGNSQCKICHNTKEMGEIWTVWSNQKHSKAYDRLASPEAIAVGQKKGLAKPPQESPECLKCHVTAYDASKTPPVPVKIAMKDGVQCETCHGPGSLHVADGKAKKMKKDESIVMSAHIKRGDEATCRKCHNEESPTWNPEKYTLKDGSKAGFDFEQAWKQVQHGIPEKK